MENKKIQIDFGQNISEANSIDLEASVNFSEVEVEKMLMVQRKSSTGPKKMKFKSKSEESEQAKQLFVTEFNFILSVSLINLLRQPLITDDHIFDYEYLKNIGRQLRLIVDESDQAYDEVALYLHLIFAQIDNLKELDGLSVEEVQSIVSISKMWNKTNVLNVKCILANLKEISALKPQLGKKKTSGGVEISIIKQPYVSTVHEKGLQISKNYVEVAIQSLGHLDIYFEPFLANQLPFQAIFWHHNFDNTEIALETYSTIFQQIVKERSSIQNIEFKQWYEEQVQKVIQGTFQFAEIKNLIQHSREQNQYVEKLLIGLLGWKDMSEEAVKLLNVFYDKCDWQIHSEYNPAISECGTAFHLNYLIQKIAADKESLIICLKAPCFNPHYQGQFFSWHKPKVVQYNSDETNYLWIQHQLGIFTKSGFYDWALFSLKQSGKEAVNKILNLDQKYQKLDRIDKNAVTVRSVKGRFIVQPEHIKQLQIHEICLDSINSDQSIYKNPTFRDAMKQVDRNVSVGVNCIYLMGCFERDTEESMNVYKKPNASSIALTNRSLPCHMLGGRQSFKELVQHAHQKGTKVVVDCTTRVSSSKISKRYQALTLKHIDDQGKKNYLYGGNGRSISYQDTTILNYRKKAAWDLLLQQILQIIQNYEVDGIYLDNGFEWPQMFKANEEELYRKENQNNENTYTNDEIFEGEVVIPTKIAGYWATKSSSKYSNPFLVKICKSLWNLYPNFLIICEGLELQDNNVRLINIIKSGPIPRLFKMPKALSQVVGIQLHQSGQIKAMTPRPITSLKKWYEEIMSSLPKNSIVIQSTTSNVWPYPAYIFKKATWALIDLFFFMPSLPMTNGLEQIGRAYKTKNLNLSLMITDNPHLENSMHHDDKKKKSFTRANSSYFGEDKFITGKHRGQVMTATNVSLKDPSQIKYLEENFRKQVGPEFGFDLAKIHMHYQHRRQLRRNSKLLSEGNFISVSAEHMFGIHTNVLSFARYNQKQMLLISINFNSGPIDMHYNLLSLKSLFKNYERSQIVIKIEDIFNELQFVEEYYLIGQLINSKIQTRIEAFKSIVWKLSIFKEEKLQNAIECSRKRLVSKVQKNPPQWIYSSVFFNEISYLLQKSKTKAGIIEGLNTLYERFIVPDNIDLSLVISKSHELYVNKHKLQKLFGILKLIQQQKDVNSVLKSRIDSLLKGNTLGPIAFVTPEIGSWSAVGGLATMVDELSKQLAKLGEQVYVISPYYEYNKKGQTNYLKKDGFLYSQNISVVAPQFKLEFGIHRGKYSGVNFIWFHNPQLFSKPYEGVGAFFVSKQLVFFALATLQSFCQLKIFPSIIVTNDWMCGFVSGYVKCNKYKEVFNGTKFIHICHNLDPLYEGRLFPKPEEGSLNWLIQLPQEWYLEYRANKLVINPSKCALQTCDNWGTVSHSYKYDLLKDSPLAPILWKHPHAFSFPNGVRKQERLSIIRAKTPGTHRESKELIQQKYFKFQKLRPEMPLLAFIGRVTKQKGVHLILDVVQALLQEYDFKIQFMVAGAADSKEQYSKYCADRMKFLTHKYPLCFWSDPDHFFSDGPLINIGADFALMPSLFEPGGIVQHQFFAGSTPVIAFRTGGLKDTVFEFDPKTQKGNGFNFMSYDSQDFKKCLRRAIECYKNGELYQKIRQNALQSVIQEEDVAKGWNNEFYRLQNKIYIDWDKVQQFVHTFEIDRNGEDVVDVQVLKYESSEYWKKDWETVSSFKEVLKNASRLKGKLCNFCFQTKKIPRPKEVFICGTWDEWKTPSKLNFDKIQKNYKISLKIKPGLYHYKYIADNQWLLTENQDKEMDLNNIENHVINVE